MLRKSIYFSLFIIILLTQTAFRSREHLSAPSSYDLIAEVNAYRISMGLYALNPDPKVMSAAQNHADWIVSTGLGGHTGASGSDETMRVYWSGYGDGETIKCDEAWASTSSVSSAVYDAWADWTHQQVMLNGWGNNYTDVGAGVADNGNGTYVFILDVCLIVGGSSPNSNPSVPLDPFATPDLSNYIFGVQAATPAPDGSIVHIVKYGQTLETISKAYEITINELRALNGMAAESTNIWPDQKLLIKKSSGTPFASQASSATGELAIGTRTLMPSFTPRPRTNTPIPTLTPTGDGTLTLESVTGEGNQKPPAKQTAGMVLIVLCGIGLIAVVFSFMKK